MVMGHTCFKQFWSGCFGRLVCHTSSSEDFSDEDGVAVSDGALRAVSDDLLIQVHFPDERTDSNGRNSNGRPWFGNIVQRCAEYSGGRLHINILWRA